MRDINAQNEHGVTALMRAAQYGHLKMVRALLDGPSTSIDLPAGDIGSANVAGTGFYRVQLTDERLASIAADGPGGLSPIERYGLIDDTWALCMMNMPTAGG